MAFKLQTPKELLIIPFEINLKFHYAGYVAAFVIDWTWMFNLF